MYIRTCNSKKLKWDKDSIQFIRDHEKRYYEGEIYNVCYDYFKGISHR